ncbi:MAG TPA: hypothetical protein VN429_00720 [Methanospirillum sp.]|uniref:hypothetical protein n=1 Tax=Methanospirillum sp. TaxID=45200 RepID=UPI002BB8D096|nr:hypothetical protein [Methanospirillum sp.]HWQ62906.1 hypothetical protein [Methanospirillum sp.]
MKNIYSVFLLGVLVIGSIGVSGCTSMVNSQDLAFLSSLQEFQNESVTRIGHINEDVKIKEWNSVKSELNGYQGVIKTEIDHLNSMQVSEKVVPIRNQAVTALKKQEVIINQIQNLSEINESVVSNLASDYLSDAIHAVASSALSGKE